MGCMMEVTRRCRANHPQPGAKIEPQPRPSRHGKVEDVNVHQKEARASQLLVGLVETNSVAWGSMRFSVSKSADSFSDVASAISSGNASAQLTAALFACILVQTQPLPNQLGKLRTPARFQRGQYLVDGAGI